METKENNHSLKKLIYILASVLVLLTVVSCGSGKKTTPVSQSSSAAATEAPASNEAQRITEKMHAEITSAVKQLRSILDVRLESATPLRMEGIVITNQTMQTPLRDVVPDNLLYSVAARVDKDALETINKLAAAKELNVSMDLKARLTPTGSSEKTIEAYDLVIRNSTEYQKACFPISLSLSKNFYDKSSPESKKDFCATVKIKDNVYSGFELFDLKYKPVGTITMPLESSANSKDLKMIIEFDEEIKLISQNYKIKQSHTIVLQLTEVSTVVNQFKK